MKKHLILILCILAITGSTIKLNAQALNGTYLIGSNAPTYKTVMSAVNDLNTKGVNGPVVFRIYSGTYDEKIIIPPISGASATNTITFTSYSNDSSLVVLKNSTASYTENFVLQLNGADFITFYKISFSSPGTTGYHRCLVLENGAHNAHIINCKFSGAINSTSGKELIYSPTTNDTCTEIRNNHFYNGADAIELSGVDENTIESGHIITNNYFNCQYAGGIDCSFSSNVLISNNIFIPDNNGYFSYGIDLWSCTSSIQVHSNIVEGLFNPYGFTNAIGIAVTALPSMASNVLIYNNYIHGNCDGIGCHADKAKIYNNTVIIDPGADGYCVYTYYADQFVYNNILINTSNSASSAIYKFYYPSSIGKLDYNNIVGNTIAKVGTTTYSILSSWQIFSNQDSHSLTRNVHFLSDSMHIQDTMMHFGKPLSEVVVDIDGEARDVNKPYVGCDEYYMDIFPADTVFCAGRTVTLDAGVGMNSYAWSPGPTSRKITFDSSGYGFGTHKISVTVKYGSFTYTDTIQFKFIDAVANAGIDQYVCTGDLVTLSGSGGVSYTWQGTINKKTITFPASTSRDYHLNVIDKYGCSDTDTVTVFVMDYPVVKLGNDTTFCEGGSATYIAGTDTNYSYVWKSLPSPDTISTSAAFVADTSGRYLVFVSNANGCLTKATVEVTLLSRPPKPQITSLGQSEFCDGDSLLLSAPINYTNYFWSDGSKNSETYIHKTDSITLIVQDANTCFSLPSDTFFVLVYPNPPKPIISLVGNSEFCKGDSVMLEAPGGYPHYIWSNGDTNWKQKVVKSGLFSLSVVDSNACQSNFSDTVEIVVFPNPPKPVITASGPLTFCDRDSVILSAPIGYSSYVWSDANEDEERTITQNGSFSLHVVDSNTCESAESDVTTVTVKPLPPKPEILITGIDSLESSTLADVYHWYLNDTLLGLTTQLIIAPKSGNFSLITELEGCMSEESDILYYVRSGLTEHFENNIIVYPNPSDGVFYLEQANHSYSKAQIYNSNGQLIQELHITQAKTQIDLSQQPEGIYLVKLHGTTEIFLIKLLKY